MHTQCSSKLLEFQDHGRRLVAKKLIFLLVFLREPRFTPSAMSRGRLDGVESQKMSKRS